MIKVNDEMVKCGKYPDGTPLMKQAIPAILGDIVISWVYENNEEMVYLYFLMKHIKANTDKETPVVLYMPYIPNARMDRVKSEEEVFTLKYFCEFINSLGFDGVYVMDAHSNVSLALLNHVKPIDINPYVCKAIDLCKPDVLFFPDEGSCKRYSEIASENDLEIAFANKTRDWKTGKILGLQLVGEENVKDKTVLIVDDICSKGGTFYHSAKKLHECGATDVYLYITHCENTVLTGDLIKSGLVKKIYTTNTIFTKTHDLIHVINTSWQNQRIKRRKSL